MKNNKGITMIALVITIVVLLILAGISIGTGNNIIKQSNLENIKTNMLLVKVKAKEYVENANFNLGTAFDKVTDENEKNARIEKAKAELKGKEITDISIFNTNTNISQEQLTTDNSNYIYYYKLDSQNLTDMGISNVKSDEKNGWYIIKYDIKNIEIEVYNTKGFENNETIYYSLTELQNIDV